MMMHKLRTDNEQNIGIYSIDIDISNCCGIVLQQTFLSPVQLFSLQSGALFVTICIEVGTQRQARVCTSFLFLFLHL